MPRGTGTYGSKRGRPPKKAAKKRRTSQTANDTIKSRLKSGKSKPSKAKNLAPASSSAPEGNYKVSESGPKFVRVRSLGNRLVPSISPQTKPYKGLPPGKGRVTQKSTEDAVKRKAAKKKKPSTKAGAKAAPAARKRRKTSKKPKRK